MPKNPDALVKLLTDKYGVGADEAEAFASQILAGKAGGHGDALRGEALSNVANQATTQMHNQTLFAKAASDAGARDKDPFLQRIYQNQLDKSTENTRDMAASAADERNRELSGVADTELSRIANMIDWSNGVKPLPGGGYTQPFQPAPGFTATAGGPSTVVPVQPRPDPYQEKIERAYKLRQQLLGY